MTEPVITVTMSVDGQVVHWHQTVSAATNHRPTISASRNGVAVHAEYLTNIPEDWVTAAKTAYNELRRNRQADLRHLATHRHGHGLMNGPLEPVEKEEGDRG